MTDVSSTVRKRSRKRARRRRGAVDDDDDEKGEDEEERKGGGLHGYTERRGIYWSGGIREAKVDSDDCVIMCNAGPGRVVLQFRHQPIIVLNPVRFSAPCLSQSPRLAERWI